MGAIEQAVGEWVGALDGGVARDVLVLLNHDDLPGAERLLARVVGRTISLKDPLVRDALLDALELKVAPEESSEDKETVLLPLHPVPSRDVRDDDAGPQVDQARRSAR